MTRTVRNAFDRTRTGFDCDPAQGRTKQNFKAECDINNIMKKYIKTGAISHFAKHAGYYDFCPDTDYRGCLEVLNKAQEMFADLPAVIREKFKNDPGVFLEFVQDPKNLPELREMGLANPEPTPAKAPPPKDQKPLDKKAGED